MTEFKRTPEEKINVPQFEADQRQRDARKEAMDQSKAALAEGQRKAVFEDPHESFKYRLPLDMLQHYTEAELVELRTAEEIAFNKHRSAARDKEAEKRAWIAAGGTEASHERRWREGGEEAEIARRAEAIRRGVASPY